MNGWPLPVGRARLMKMRALDEVLRLARELTAPERRRLLEELERLEDESLAHDDHMKAWAEWVEHGPQCLLEDDDSEARRRGARDRGRSARAAMLL